MQYQIKAISDLERLISKLRRKSVASWFYLKESLDAIIPYKNMGFGKPAKR
jgi:hypothetical protein